MSSKRVKNLKELGKIQMLMEATIAFANLLIVTNVVHVSYFQPLMKEGKVRDATKYAINLTNHFIREKKKVEAETLKNASGLVDVHGKPIPSA